jgi:hypothetical protein
MLNKEIIDVNYEATSTEVAPLKKRHAIEPHLRIDSMAEAHDALVKRIEELENQTVPFRVQSEGQNEFRKALAKAQSECSPAKRGALNPHLKASYATIDNCWLAIRDALSNNDLGIVFEPRHDHNGDPVLIAEVIHFKSGEYRSYTNKVFPTTNQSSKSMALKGGVTSAERLFLISLFGLE